MGYERWNCFIYLIDAQGEKMPYEKDVIVISVHN